MNSTRTIAAMLSISMIFGSILQSGTLHESTVYAEENQAVTAQTTIADDGSHSTDDLTTSISTFPRENEYMEWYELNEQGLIGDANGDNKISISDAVLLCRYINEDAVQIDTVRADYTHDDKLSMDDVTMILRRIARLPLYPQSEGSSRNLMADFQGKAPDVSAFSSDFRKGQTDLALRLIQYAAQNDTEKNLLLSPASAIFALGMTANGTANDTRTAWENNLCDISMEELNEQLWLYRKILNESDVHIANAIWFRDQYRDIQLDSPLDTFLQTNADYYGAGAFSAPFNQTTCDEINAFVNDNTFGMIPEILDKIPDDDNGFAAMYLVNALALDQKWAQSLGEEQNACSFTSTASASPLSVQYVYGDANCYYHGNDAAGILKNFENDKISFAAFIPNDSTVSAAEFISSLDSTTLSKMISALYGGKMATEFRMPKFSCDYSTDLVKSLQSFGIPMDGDFSNMYPNAVPGSENEVSISRVLHKTHIDVNATGAQAAAATVVEMTKSTSVKPYVNFDREFIYMILDNESRIPLFIGTMSDPTPAE